MNQIDYIVESMIRCKVSCIITRFTMRVCSIYHNLFFRITTLAEKMSEFFSEFFRILAVSLKTRLKYGQSQIKFQKRLREVFLPGYTIFIQRLFYPTDTRS